MTRKYPTVTTTPSFQVLKNWSSVKSNQTVAVAYYRSPTQLNFCEYRIECFIVIEL